MDGARAHVVRLGRGQQSVVGMGGGSFWGDVLWPAEDAEADDGAAVPRATRPVDTQGKTTRRTTGYGGRSALFTLRP